MTNQGKMTIGIIVALVLGFGGGYLVKTTTDKEQRQTIAETIPVHKLNQSEKNLLTSNELIAPDVWRIYMDPFFTPVVTPGIPVVLPKLGGFPVSLPSVKTVQTDKEVRVTATVPGLQEKDVDIQVGKNELAIKGKKEEQAKKDKSFQTVRESFEEIVQLPCPVDGDKAKATIRNGELTVILPKAGSNIAQSQHGNWQ
ncbi:MAG TPA: Hsp20/alpha crystallin family protein [Oculatellaceae cyanobacterium]